MSNGNGKRKPLGMFLLVALATVVVLGGIGFVMGRSEAAGTVASEQQGAERGTQPIGGDGDGERAYQRGYAEGLAEGRDDGERAGASRGRQAAERQTRRARQRSRSEGGSGRDISGLCGTTTGGRRLCGQQAVAFCRRYLPGNQLTAEGEARCRGILRAAG